MYSANRVAKDWSANVEAAPASACSSSPDTLANTASFGRPSSRAGSLTSCNRAPGTTPPPSTSARGCTPGHAFSGLKSASQTLQPSPQNEAAKAHAVCPMLRVDPCRRQATRTPLPCRAIQAACAGARQRLCWGPPPWQPEPRASKASPQTSSKIKVRGPWRRLSNSWTMSSSVWLEMSTTMPKRLPASPSSSAAPPRAPAGACGAAAEACSVETSSARPEGDASDEEATPQSSLATEWPLARWSRPPTASDSSWIWCAMRAAGPTRAARSRSANSKKSSSKCSAAFAGPAASAAASPRPRRRPGRRRRPRRRRRQRPSRTASRRGTAAHTFSPPPQAPASRGPLREASDGSPGRSQRSCSTAGQRARHAW
mmetsp:Transcript_89794/g.290100  ORF Transcript_89794/g.290100 Transcript_89794/m.290100 type:complete len:371 (-) Transcript_89794:441-1553(-)